MRKLLGAGLVLAVMAGLAAAETFTGTVKSISDKSIEINVFKFDKEAKKFSTETKKFTLTKDTKYQKLTKFGSKDKETKEETEAGNFEALKKAVDESAKKADEDKDKDKEKKKGFGFGGVFVRVETNDKDEAKTVTIFPAFKGKGKGKGKDKDKEDK